jgi:carbon-monoxide dehydrogenase medium subunit
MNDMTNSHILAHEFTYLEPRSVSEAIELLVTHGDAARVLAGGTDLLVQMKMERLNPAYVIGIGRLNELQGIRQDVDKLAIGALTTIRNLARNTTVRGSYTALAEACAAFSTAQVQAMGTVGGNLCNGSPASDTAPGLIVLGAEVVLVGPEGETRLPLERFFRGPGKTARRADQLLTAVEVPLQAMQSGSAFVKIGRVAADIAKANAAVHLVRDGDRIVDCRLAFGSVAPTPMRTPRAEAILRGQTMTPELISQAAAVAAEEISPIDDVRSTADYRRRVVAALAVDGINRAWERAANGESANLRIGEWLENDEGQRTKDEGRSTLHAIRNTHPASRITHHEITLTVNGVSRHLHVADNDLLLNLLREDLELTGTKYGCGIGECSACTVLMDGRPVLACLVLAAAADGSHIRTVEGLAVPDGTLDPLQEAFIEHAALQCGFCTPGMLMTAKDLLEENPHPTEADVRDHLRGNMCRCTGYAAIVRAVLAASETMTKDQ